MKKGNRERERYRKKEIKREIYRKKEKKRLREKETKRAS